MRSHPHLQVALLEDDTRAAEALVEAFRPLGIVATPFADSASLRAAIAHRRFDAYVLDWLLGDGTAAAHRRGDPPAPRRTSRSSWSPAR